MPSTPRVPATNRLLAALPGKDRERLLASCEPVELTFDDILCQSGENIGHVYFPIESFVALMAPLNGGTHLEVGLVGSEGMIGIPLVLGVDVSPFHAWVQGAGPALRMNAASFRRELEQSRVLQWRLNRYLCVVMSQLAQTAACTRFHWVEARLARLLLTIQDRAHANEFHITHVSLAYMLGVRRVGITKAASSLQERRFIHYSRGDIAILDRVGLEAASCRCYRAEKETYERILG